MYRLNIDVWPQRRAHSVYVWIETLCWEHNMAVENAANTINQNMSLYVFTHETS